MNELVKVEIEYVGFLANTTGKKGEIIEIPSDVAETAKTITAYLKTAYGISQPVLIMVNGRNIINYIKMQKEIGISEGTCFKVMPILSGG
jgi:molybdopterin converting factor small subunit